MRIYNSKGAWVILLALIFLPFQAYAEKIGVGVGVGVGVPSSSSGDSHTSSLPVRQSFSSNSTSTTSSNNSTTRQNFSNTHNSSAIYKTSNLNSANQTSNTNQNTQNRNNVSVYVGVNSRTNTVESVQIGDHGTCLTHSQINNMFGGNNSGTVNVNNFQQTVNNKNFHWNISPNKCKISGVNQQQAEQLLNRMDTAKKYMANLDYNFSCPKTINMGDNGMGQYGDDNNWYLKDVNDVDAIYSKVTQRAIHEKYPNVSYTNLEGFSRYFSSHLPGSTENQYHGHVYNPNADSSGQAIHDAYTDFNAGKINQAQLQQIINENTNNNWALSEALQNSHIDPATADLALQNLNQSNNQNDGSTVINSLQNADRQNNGGNNTNSINTSFTDHGMNYISKERSQASN